jgi:hypothetical protein
VRIFMHVVSVMGSVGIGLPLPWLDLQIGPPHRAKRIGLPDQARKLRKRVAFPIGRRT